MGYEDDITLYYHISNTITPFFLVQRHVGYPPNHAAVKALVKPPIHSPSPFFLAHGLVRAPSVVTGDPCFIPWPTKMWLSLAATLTFPVLLWILPMTNVDVAKRMGLVAEDCRASRGHLVD